MKEQKQDKSTNEKISGQIDKLNRDWLIYTCIVAALSAIIGVLIERFI